MSSDSMFSIDPLQLDQEWLVQAQRYLELADKLAERRKTHEEAKHALDVVEAEIDKAIRIDPKEYGLDGDKAPTEPAIKRTILLQRKHAKATQAVIDAKYGVDKQGARVEAMEQRKWALQKAVDLMLAGYMAEPRASKGSKERMDDIEKKALRKKGQQSRD